MNRQSCRYRLAKRCFNMNLPCAHDFSRTWRLNVLLALARGRIGLDVFTIWFDLIKDGGTIADNDNSRFIRSNIKFRHPLNLFDSDLLDLVSVSLQVFGW